MRYGIVMFLFLLAALTGCAHISHQDPQTGLEAATPAAPMVLSRSSGLPIRVPTTSPRRQSTRG